jgi:hypothetical protein
MISPCYQCEKRQEDCHDSCAEYQEFRQMMRDINHIRKGELHYDYRTQRKTTHHRHSQRE